MDIYEQITKNVFGLQEKILKASKVDTQQAIDDMDDNSDKEANPLVIEKDY